MIRRRRRERRSNNNNHIPKTTSSFAAILNMSHRIVAMKSLSEWRKSKPVCSRFCLLSGV